VRWRWALLVARATRLPLVSKAGASHVPRYQAAEIPSVSLFGGTGDRGGESVRRVRGRPAAISCSQNIAGSLSPPGPGGVRQHSPRREADALASGGTFVRNARPAGGLRGDIASRSSQRVPLQDLSGALAARPITGLASG